MVRCKIHFRKPVGSGLVLPCSFEAMMLLRCNPKSSGPMTTSDYGNSVRLAIVTKMNMIHGNMKESPIIAGFSTKLLQVNIPLPKSRGRRNTARSSATRRGISGSFTPNTEMTNTAMTGELPPCFTLCLSSAKG